MTGFPVTQQPNIIGYTTM